MVRGPQRLGAFARELASGKRPYEAAIAAGYPVGKNTQRMAQRRAAREDVKRMVAELRRPIAEHLEITQAELIKRADKVFNLAIASNQLGAAINALKELGILSGKRVERAERGEPGEFDRMSDEELDRAVSDAAAKLGLVPKNETQH